MKTGWNCKDAAEVLKVAPTKVSQCMGPALLKVAALMLADPLKTSIDLTEAMQRVSADLLSESHPFKLSATRP